MYTVFDVCLVCVKKCMWVRAYVAAMQCAIQTTMDFMRSNLMNTN